MPKEYALHKIERMANIPNSKVEELCADLGIGVGEFGEFLLELRKERAANKLNEWFLGRSIDELTDWINATTLVLESYKENPAPNPQAKTKLTVKKK